MSGGSDNDMSATAWPGFVDILSSVLIMFVFFVMIVASALYFHIIIFKEQIVAQAQAQIAMQSDASVISSQNRVLQQEIKDMELQVANLSDQLSGCKEQIHQEASQFSESTNQQITIDEQENSLIVFFGRDSISLTPESKEKIKTFIADFVATHDAEFTTVQILAGKDPELVGSATRKIAVARMLNVRNMFLDTDISKENLIPKISEGEKLEDNYHWVKVILKER